MTKKYEEGQTMGFRHTIESKNTLCCAETGRVIAVFYNDYDLEQAIELLNSQTEFKSEQADKELAIYEGNFNAICEALNIDPNSSFDSIFEAIKSSTNQS